MFGRDDGWVALGETAGSCGPRTGSPLRVEIWGGRGGAGQYITRYSEVRDAGAREDAGQTETILRCFRES